ncbi:ATP-grasp domain-containing protein [Streptomyces sp. NPDC002994]|uniref:ATP-grasp domain-containing protein n=1 Tax=Streptomyces sp. NPDC002994 TaxID=3154441 RepID=UPI0033A2F3BE
MRRRIAFLRSVDIQRADPYIHGIAGVLRAHGAEARLFHTHGTCAPGEFPGSAEKVDASATPDEIVERLRRWGADGAISISLPDENALRDSVIKDKLAVYGIPTVMTPPAATRALCDKWETKRLLTEHGLTTPPGVLVDGDLLNGRGLPVPAYADSIRLAARDVGYPLLSKPLWDSTSMGIRFIDSPEALDDLLIDAPSGNVILERCVVGELCTVDIVGAEGEYRVQPLCWTGTAGGPPVFTFADLRYCGPRERADADFRPVAERLKSMCAALGVQGSVNVDMIYSDGVYHVLEVNPRIGGATTLSIAASGHNTFESLVHMLLGDWPRPDGAGESPGGPGRWALECLISNPTPELVSQLRSRVDLVTAHDLIIDGENHGGIMTFTCPRGDEARVTKELGELAAATGFIAPEMLEKIRNLLTPAASAAR